MIVNPKPEYTITFEEQLNCLKKAAGVLKSQRYYLSELDEWDIINGAWVIMEKQNTIKKLDAKGIPNAKDLQKLLLACCFNAAKAFINRTYKLKTEYYRADLSFLRISIDTETGHTLDMPYDKTPEDVISDDDLYQRVMTIARDILTVNEYRTLELYYRSGYTQQEVADALGLKSKGGTCDRLKRAIQKIRNELNVTTKLLEVLT